MPQEPVEPEEPEDRTVRLYYAFTTRFQSFLKLLESCFSGFWMGILSDEKLARIDEHYYRETRFYRTREYNLKGLWPWEENQIETHFPKSGNILLLGSGGGREAVALQRKGYSVDSFECNDQLMEFSNQLLAAEGLVPNVRGVARNECPQADKMYDAAVLGWGMYTLVPGRERRVSMLVDISRQLRPGAPLLLSFFDLNEIRFRHRVGTGIANIFRRITRRPLFEIGDDLSPNFVHYFPPGHVEHELEEAGFRLVHFSTREYAHAVAVKGKPI